MCDVIVSCYVKLWNKLWIVDLDDVVKVRCKVFDIFVEYVCFILLRNLI